MNSHTIASRRGRWLAACLAAALTGPLTVGARPAHAAGDEHLARRGPAALTWSNFPRVSGQDIIEVSEKPGARGAEIVSLCLTSATDIHWRKALAKISNNGDNVGEVVLVNDDHGPTCMAVTLTDVARVEFWKAGFLGFPKHVYNLHQGVLREKAGMEVTLRWVAD